MRNLLPIAAVLAAVASPALAAPPAPTTEVVEVRFDLAESSRPEFASTLERCRNAFLPGFLFRTDPDSG